MRCHCPQACVLTIDLLDSLGRSFLHKQFPLQQGDNEVSFSIARLPAGEYNAWASIGNQTAIRSMAIQPRKNLSGLLQRWFL